MSAQPAKQPAKVSFRISTYFKRPRGQAGITNLASGRIGLGKAINWVLCELPADAVTITPDAGGGGDAVTIRIDWAKVPTEIRDGTR